MEINNNVKNMSKVSKSLLLLHSMH